MRKQNSTDLTTGPIFRKLLLFVLPILFSNLLQQFYNAADTIIVGNFVGKTAIAAVGSTASVTMLLLNLFTGLSIGSNVICANLFGAKNQDELDDCMHTSMLLGIVGGLFFGVLGVCLAKTMLTWMGTPDTVIDQAVLYLRIFSCGIPASLLYNFGAAILRATEDTKRPMYILTVSGIVNVLLNLFFVIVLHWDVAGVAVATVVSQTVSAVVVCFILFNPNGEYKLSIKKLRFHGKQLRTIIAVGVPCGLNGIVFSISNILAQAAINSLGDVVVAANVAAGSISDFVFLVISAFYTANVSFAGQCYGARKYRRIDKLLVYSVIMCEVGIVVLATLASLFPEALISLYTKDAQVIKEGIPRLLIASWGYVFYTFSETAMGCLRGMRKFIGPTVLNAFCICMLRVIWILFIFPLRPSLSWVILCYPLSWFVSAVGQITYYLISRRKLHESETLQTA